VSDPGPSSPTSLTGLFRDFHGRVARCRQRLEDSADEVALAEAQEPLLEVLTAMEPGAEDRYATDSVSLQQARYLMACFADDVLGRGEAGHGAAWRSASLESNLFRSDAGDSEIFQRIDKLLEVGDPGRRELAALYLMALALGFRGRLEAESGAVTLQAYRNRLLALAAPERQGADAARWISPTAYRHTASGKEKELLPNLKLWGWIAGGAVILLLVVSSLVFSEHTGGIAASVERILERPQQP
jgi:type VI secretion system protein ImpK